MEVHAFENFLIDIDAVYNFKDFLGWLRMFTNRLDVCSGIMRERKRRNRDEISVSFIDEWADKLEFHYAVDNAKLTIGIRTCEPCFLPIASSSVNEFVLDDDFVLDVQNKYADAANYERLQSQVELFEVILLGFFPGIKNVNDVRCCIVKDSQGYSAGLPLQNCEKILGAWMCNDCTLRIRQAEEHICSSVHSYIYLIGNELHGLYKIGKSDNPNRRAKELMSIVMTNLEVLHSLPADDVFKAESLLHVRFNAKNIKGEWFQLEPEDVEYIKSLEGFRDGMFIID